MRTLTGTPGFSRYILVVLLNAMTDLGHKVVLQNTVFKCWSGTEQIALTALVNGLILLPFILLFTPSGLLSDRFPKQMVIRASAIIAVPITVLLAICYLRGLFWPAFWLTLLLSAHSAVLSPAKYGYIKELTGKELLGQANAAVQAVTIIAILAGTLLYSVFFERLIGAAGLDPESVLRAVAPCGYALVACSVAEALFALTLPARERGRSTPPITAGSLVSIRHVAENLRKLRSNTTIWLCVVGLAIFWAVSQVLLAAFGAHLKALTGEMSTVVAQGILALGGVGVIIGAGIAGRSSRNYIETGLIPIGAMGMTVALFLLPGLGNPAALGVLVFAYGVCGGMVIVPLNALIQFNAPDPDTGSILAGSNFIQNLLMLLFLAATAGAAWGNISSLALFSCMGFVVLCGTLYTLYKLPQSLLRIMLRLFAAQRYRLTVSGLDNIPAEGGLLLLGNHTSWVDWAMLNLAMPRRMRFVMAREFYEVRYLKWFLDLFGVIPISPFGNKNALRNVAAALNNGECVVIFPEGAISRNGQLGLFKRGFEEAAKNASCTIVPFYLRGLWGSEFSFATRKLQAQARRGRLREVTVCFGPGMPGNATVRQVKQAVFRLSIDAWGCYAKTFEPVHVSWLRAAKHNLAAPSVIDSSGEAFSNRGLLAACLLASRWLGGKLGKSRNAGILLPAGAAGIIANLAVLMRGQTVVNLNYTLGREPLAHALRRADIKTVITSREFLARLGERGDTAGALEGQDLLYMEDFRKQTRGLASLLALGMARCLPVSILKALFFARNSTGDTAAILFSSGSEGLPKGVMLSHANIVGNVRQVASLFNAREDDVILGTLPLFHAFGLTITAFLPLLEGIPLICHPDPTDARTIGQMVAKHGVTLLCGTPTFLGLYARNRKLHPAMFGTLRLVVSGAERLSADVREVFRARFNQDIHEGYGTTETTPVASVNARNVVNTSDFSVQIGRKDGSAGQPLPGSAVRIVDPATLEDLPMDEGGLILIGGTQIMKGYLDDEARTREAIVERDGIRWYKTGDKGRLDEDGFLFVIDRYSRFAKVAGEMISLAAVEEALLKAAPDGAEAVAVALPDVKKGERVVALISGTDTPENLRSSLLGLGLDAKLAPSRIIPVPSIPKLGTGKTDLVQARRLAEAHDVQ